MDQIKSKNRVSIFSSGRRGGGCNEELFQHIYSLNSAHFCCACTLFGWIISQFSVVLDWLVPITSGHCHSVMPSPSPLALKRAFAEQLEIKLWIKIRTECSLLLFASPLVVLCKRWNDLIVLAVCGPRTYLGKVKKSQCNGVIRIMFQAVSYIFGHHYHLLKPYIKQLACMSTLLSVSPKHAWK